MEEWQSRVCYLHFDVKDADLAFLRYVFYGLDARPVEITAELCMLYERPLTYEVCEVFLGCEIVLATVLLAISRLSSCV